MEGVPRRRQRNSLAFGRQGIVLDRAERCAYGGARPYARVRTGSRKRLFRAQILGGPGSSRVGA